jgi:threonine dehydrogenase-like Zn-dependent dehydrogenase
MAQPTREPGPGEVRVRLEGCGVCASNLPVWEGRPWFQYPIAAGAPGHEGWGRIDALGEGVQGFETGERVALISGHAYAEMDITSAEGLVKLPPELDDEPFPGEPLGCAMNIFERSGVRAGQTVAIVGAGFLGVLLTQLAVHAGAQVVAISRRDYSLEEAKRAGAQHAIAQAMRMSSGRGFDRAIEVVGMQSTLDIAGAITAERGRLVIAGYHQDGPRQVDMQSWNWRGIDVINAHERSTARYVDGVRRAVQAVLDGRMDPFPYLTHRLPLGDIETAFELLRERPAGFMKAVVVCETQA